MKNLKKVLVEMSDPELCQGALEIMQQSYDFAELVPSVDGNGFLIVSQIVFLSLSIGKYAIEYRNKFK